MAVELMEIGLNWPSSYNSNHFSAQYLESQYGVEHWRPITIYLTEKLFFLQVAWDGQTAIDFLDYFLSYVEKCFKALRTSSPGEFLPKVPVTLKFDIDSFQKITVTKDVYNEYELLPDWFISHITS